MRKAKTYSTAATASLASAVNGGVALGAGVVVVVNKRLHLDCGIEKCYRRLRFVVDVDV